MGLNKENGRSHKHDRPLTQFVQTYTCALMIGYQKGRKLERPQTKKTFYQKAKL